MIPMWLNPHANIMSPGRVQKPFSNAETLRAHVHFTVLFKEKDSAPQTYRLHGKSMGCNMAENFRTGCSESTRNNDRDTEVTSSEFWKEMKSLRYPGLWPRCDIQNVVHKAVELTLSGDV